MIEFLGEEMRGFRSGKYRGKRKELYVEIMNLEKSYNRLSKEELQRVLYECGDYLVRGVTELVEGSKTYPRWEMRVREYFEVTRRALRKRWRRPQEWKDVYERAAL